MIYSSDFPGLDPATLAAKYAAWRTNPNATGVACTSDLQTFFIAARTQRAILEGPTPYLIDAPLIWGYNPATEPAPGGSWGNRPLLAGVLQGEGWASTVIKWIGPLAPTTPMIIYSCPASRFEDIAIQGSKKAGYGMVAHHTGRSIVRIMVDGTYGDGVLVKGNWYGPGLDVHGSNDHTHWFCCSFYNSVSGCGVRLPTDAGAEQGGQVFDHCIAEGNGSHGFRGFGQGIRFLSCCGEGNAGYGFLIEGMPGGGTGAVDNFIVGPWTEGNTLGGIHFTNAQRNKVITTAGFQSLSQESDCANCILVGSDGALDIVGQQKLHLSSPVGGAPSISATGSAGQTGQPIASSGLKITPLTISVPAGVVAPLTIDVTKAARFVINMHADISNLIVQWPIGAAAPTNLEVLLDFVQLDVGVGHKVLAWTFQRPKTDGSGFTTVTVRWIDGAANKPVIGSSGANTKGSTHDIVRMLYTGDWLELGRTLNVST